jgi:hypothetical protein
VSTDVYTSVKGWTWNLWESPSLTAREGTSGTVLTSLEHRVAPPKWSPGGCNLAPCRRNLLQKKSSWTTFPTRQGRADRGIHGGNSVLIPRIIFLASTVYKKYRIAYKCCSYLISILRVHGAPRSTKLTNDPPEQLPQHSVCQGSVHHMHDMLDHLKHDRAKIPASAAIGIYGWLLDRTFSAI